MTQEQLDAIQRMSASELLGELPDGPQKRRLLLTLESALNIEWWRGYRARTQQEVEEGRVLRIAESGIHPDPWAGFVELDRD